MRPSQENRKSRISPSTSIKICLDGRSLQDQPTGVGTYTSNLLQHILPLAPDFHFTLVMNGNPADGSWLRRERIQIVNARLPISNNFLWMNVALRRQIRKLGCNLFHSPGYTVPLSPGATSIVTLHDISYAACPQWYPFHHGMLRQAWYRLSAVKADSILTISEFSRREIMRVYGIPEERITVTRLGVDPERFKRIERKDQLEDLKRRYNLKGDFLLFVGDIHPRRNVRRILEAFAWIKSSGAAFQNLQLVLIGRNLDSSLTSTISSCTHGDSVCLLGYAPAEDLPLFYSLANAFVFPSFYEGFGLGVVEAMACGCPVIVSKGTACDEVAGKAAIPVDPGDTKSITDAITAVLSSPDVASRHSAYGLERSREFRWHKTAEATLSVYNKLLGKSGSGLS